MTNIVITGDEAPKVVDEFSVEDLEKTSLDEAVLIRVFDKKPKRYVFVTDTWEDIPGEGALIMFQYSTLKAQLINQLPKSVDLNDVDIIDFKNLQYIEEQKKGYTWIGMEEEE